MPQRPAWLSEIADGLAARDAAEKDAFGAVIRAQQLAQERAGAAALTLNELESQLETARQAAETLRVAAAKGSEQSEEAAKARELAAQVQSLKEELGEAYKAQGTNAQRLLTALDRVKALEAQTAALESDKSALETKIGALDVRVRDHEELLTEKNGALQILRDELAALQLELVTREADLVRVRQENGMLVERWMAKMQEEADQLNLSNQVEASLRLSGSRPRSASASSATVDRLAEAPPPAIDAVPRILVRTATVKGAELTSVAVTRDGRLVAAGSSGDRYVRLFDGRTLLPGRTLVGAVSGNLDVALSADGELALGCGPDPAIAVCNTSTCRVLCSLTGHNGRVHAAQFTTSNKIVSGSHDRTVKLWDLARGYCVRTMFTVSSCNDVAALDSDGQILASGHVDHSVRVWDTRTGNCVRELAGLHEEQITSVASAPAGAPFFATLSRDNSVQIVDTRTFEVLRTLRHPQLRVARNWSRLCWSPDAAFLAAPSALGTVALWRADSGEAFDPPLALSSRSQPALPLVSVAWAATSDAACLYAASAGPELTLWGLGDRRSSTGSDPPSL